MQYKRVVGMVPALEVDIGKARMVFGNSDTRVTELNARLAELMAKSGPTDEEEAKLQVCVWPCCTSRTPSCAATPAMYCESLHRST